MMRIKLMVVMVLLLALPFGLFFATGGVEANQVQSDEVEVIPILRDYDETIEADRGATPRSDFAVHGSSWARESPSMFSSFKVMGWGTAAKVKAAGYQWVHISIPYLTYIEDIPQYVRYVEFCAASTNGASTKPVKLDVWAHTTRISSTAISWPADNGIHCYGVTYNPAVWKQDIGVSVQLYFANSTDKITLYKAWLQTQE